MRLFMMFYILTVLVGRILHSVRPVTFVRDVGVCGST